MQGMLEVKKALSFEIMCKFKTFFFKLMFLK